MLVPCYPLSNSPLKFIQMFQLFLALALSQNISYDIYKVAFLKRLAVNVFGARGLHSDAVNGIYLYHGMKDGKPYYGNLANGSLLYNASDGLWCFSQKGDFDANKTSGICFSFESDIEHPSRCRQWMIWEGKWVEQPAIKVATLVSLCIRIESIHFLF